MAEQSMTMNYAASAATLSPTWRAALRCVNCRGELVETELGRALRCRHCGVFYSSREGVFEFTSINEFYEREGFVSSGTDFSDSPVGWLKRYFARHHYLHEIARHVSPGARVIEIGCGGGSRYLARQYHMLGVDLSTASARQAARIYPAVIRADCVQVPLADASVDAVVSSFILEHFEGDSFRRFFSEMRRVLKPGGRMIHYFDLENDAPFTRWAKTQPWYQSLFVEERGHYCLRHLREWEEGFAAAGFATLKRRFSCKTWLQDLSIWGRLADPRVSGPPRAFGRLVRSVSRTFGRPADVAMCLYQDTCEGLFPDTWASKVIWVVEKK